MRVIAGSSLNTPVICQTRTRRTRRGGMSVAAADEWDRYFQGREERKRDLGVVDAQRGRRQLFRAEE